MSLCDFDGRVVVYAGYGNVVSVVPIANVRTGDKIDMTAADRVTVCIGGVVGDSDDVPSYVWWEEIDGEWVIHFKPGMFTAVPTGEQTAAIVIYSNTYPNGVVLTHTFPLVIESIC